HTHQYNQPYPSARSRTSNFEQPAAMSNEDNNVSSDESEDALYGPPSDSYPPSQTYSSEEKPLLGHEYEEIDLTNNPHVMRKKMQIGAGKYGTSKLVGSSTVGGDGEDDTGPPSRSPKSVRVKTPIAVGPQPIPRHRKAGLATSLSSHSNGHRNPKQL